MPVTPAEPPPIPIPEQTTDSAVAFLQWWIAALNYAELTGDTTQLRQNSLPECVFCNGQIENIEGIYRDGGRIESGGNTDIDDFVPSQVDLNGYITIQFTGATPAGQYVSSEGVTTAIEAVQPSDYVAGVRWADGVWLLRGLAENEGGA